MNISEINWDFNAAGTWPTPIKAATVLLVSLLVAGGWVYYDTLDQLDELERLEQEERDLKTTFETKQHKAANLQAYRDQLKQIEASLGEMLKQMPTKAEVASLLVDISQTGLASGLEFELFKLAPEINREFYLELPINIRVIGKFDELGLFVSGLASLPRIVTVHDVKINPVADKDNKKTGMLHMEAVIKTYSEGGTPAAAASNRKGGK